MGHDGKPSTFRFRKRISKLQYLGTATFSFVVLTGAWAVLSSLRVFPSDFFPEPVRVASCAVSLLGTGDFVLGLLASAGRIGLAFLASAILAIPLGLAMSSFKRVEAFIEPVVDFIRYVPVPALLPIFVLVSGSIGELPKFLVLFSGTFFQLVLLIMDDADNVPSIYFDLARTLGASTKELIRDVLVPCLTPLIYDRLRITLGWCWTYLVIAELIAVQHGIGHSIKEAQRFNAADQLFVCCIVLGLIGVSTDLLAKFSYRHLFPYAEKAALQAR